MIKKKDDEVVPGFDIEKYDTSVLTEPHAWRRSAAMRIRRSGPAAVPQLAGKLKAAWLADAVARADRKKAPVKKNLTAESAEHAEKDKDSETVAAAWQSGAVSKSEVNRRDPRATLLHPLR